ncbi:SGNH hydrolase-type esterase domain-containing protein [Powellomyces hirtus]|nr:SGNH hydrolase-type esterase domain-containing protein [Powellomyces hirtus]
MQLTNVFSTVLLALAGTSIVSAAAVPTARKYSFALAGDSTTATNGGWGDSFCSLVAAGTCFNGAKGGATTASFVAGGYWTKVLNNAKEAVARGETAIVTIQFGHNDQKVEKNMSLAQYSANMAALVDQVKAIKATPMIVTSLCRRTFAADGTLTDSLKPWAEAAKAVALDKKIKFLDLHTVSFAYVKAIGKAAANRLNLAQGDLTHINTNGGIIFSRIVADKMTKASAAAGASIAQNPTLSQQIASGTVIF